MGGLLHLVQRRGAWACCGPVQCPPCCTKCNSPPINGQCTNNCIAIWWSVALRLKVAIKGLNGVFRSVNPFLTQWIIRQWIINFLLVLTSWNGFVLGVRDCDLHSGQMQLHPVSYGVHPNCAVIDVVSPSGRWRAAVEPVTVRQSSLRRLERGNCRKG